MLAAAYVCFRCTPGKDGDTPMSGGEGHLFNQNCLHECTVNRPPTVPIYQAETHLKEPAAREKRISYSLHVPTPDDV
jgi:hypothetical protein